MLILSIFRPLDVKKRKRFRELSMRILRNKKRLRLLCHQFPVQVANEEINSCRRSHTVKVFSEFDHVSVSKRGRWYKKLV